ncbi:MAG TPA: hypothetical protein VK186_27200 [Candidatus Deferrimicrobium sp.]|nr:hypothetical protein [Candidatus Deferrimicrobium sp.]
MLIENPFNTGSPARGEGFFERKKILHNITSFIKKKTQFSLLILGQRRIGKTSLLKKIQDDLNLREIVFPVYFNLQDKTNCELHRLLFEIAGKIVNSLELKMNLKEESFMPDRASSYFQKKFIPRVMKRLPDRKQLLLLFDEFDVFGLTEDMEDQSISDTMASKQLIPYISGLIEVIHAKEYPVKFIFAIGLNYKDLNPGRFEQLIKFGTQEELSCFSEEETRAVLKMSDSSIPFDTGAMAEVYSLTFGHPYFTQGLASKSFAAAVKMRAGRVTRDIVRQEFMGAINSYSSGVYWIWDSLSANDQVVLYIMALIKEENHLITIDSIREKAATLDLASVIVNLTHTVDRLKLFKFITDNNQGEYEFCGEFIRKWIVGNVSEAEIMKLRYKNPKQI